MRGSRDLLEWEYDCYRGRKKSTMYRAVYLTVVAAWAILIVALLLSDIRRKEEPAEEPVVEETVPEKIPVVAEIQLYQIPKIDQVEETDEAIDLTKLKQIENATITAYCICEKCCGKGESHPAYGITASGREAEPYLSVAVDPFLIPLGSTVYLDYGDGELLQFRADDTGSGVAGAHIDVCYPDHQSALEHGVQTARVYWEVTNDDTVRNDSAAP